MFRDDFEFHEDAAPSHLGARPRRAPKRPRRHRAGRGPAPRAVAGPAGCAVTASPVAWAPDAERELAKIPFFVRGKARRNTERFAQDSGVATITVETLYDAKAHFGR